MSKRLVCGVGINDVDYKVRRYKTIDGKQKMIWACPFYVRWTSMLVRCYSEKYLKKYPTYEGCKVCDEWLVFSNFKGWIEQQNWEGRHLDKDFLVEGNKVYSPSTCTLIPSKLNTFLTACNAIRGDYPLGVYYTKKKDCMTGEYNKPYRSQIRNQMDNQVSLGTYATSEEAHQRYLEEKLKYCKEYIAEFKDEPLIIKGLERIKDKVHRHIKYKLELTEF